MVPNASLSRRQLLRLAALGGGAAAGGLLGGCRALGGRWGGGGAGEALLLSARGSLPPAWIKGLPDPWRAQTLDAPAAVVQAAGRPAAAMLQLGDGWALQLPAAALQPFGAEALLAQLDPLAQPVSRLFRPEGAAALAFPWAFGTWVLLLRNRPDLLRRRSEGWTLLLEPSLRQKLVLPSSPRLVMELALRQLGLASGDPAALDDPRLVPQLRRLRQQALALDERDGLNLLLAGDAEAAVVPSHRAVALLLSDPRLAALLPASGSPLWWSLLLRPAGASTPVPLEWLRDGLRLPLLDRLLAGGWVPPLPRARLAPALARWPEPVRQLLLPPEPVLARCNSLPPFTAAQQQRWQAVWDQAMVA
jgi:hypothetical protein